MLIGGVVGGGEDELGGGAAVGERRPEAAAAAKAAVMPGTISKGMAAAREGGDLLAGAAEDERVAGLEAEDGDSARSVLRRS